MILSVNSALARLNIDPWREALRLSAMERTAAALLLCRMIAHLAHRPDNADVEGIAARLVKLLPARSAAREPAPKGLAARSPFRRLATWQIGLIVVLVGLVAYAWLCG
jgi:hypothetical protein